MLENGKEEQMGIKQKEKILFLVGGPEEGVVGRRARALAKGVSLGEIHFEYKKNNRWKTFWYFLRKIFIFRPKLIVVFENSVAGILAIGVGKMLRRYRVVLETGDVPGEFARSVTGRSFLGVLTASLLEKTGYRLADQIVVRGSFHQQHLASIGFSNVHFIPEGYEASLFTSSSFSISSPLRKELDLENLLTFGVMGSAHWNKKIQLPYGWDVIEALAYLRDYPIKGVLICDGTGIPHLKKRAQKLEVSSQVLFLENIPHPQLPNYLACVDICISTQTNNLVGWVRTTCKLPEYMALGKFILATRVGEASKVLPEEMLLPYQGIKDPDHPRRLASRVLEIYHNREILKLGALNQEIAAKHFDYNILRPRFLSVVESLI